MLKMMENYANQLTDMFKVPVARVNDSIFNDTMKFFYTGRNKLFTQGESTCAIRGVTNAMLEDDGVCETF